MLGNQGFKLPEVAVTSHAIHTHYISKDGNDVFITSYPHEGSLKCVTTISLEEFSNQRIFKRRLDIWSFAQSIGKPVSVNLLHERND